MLDISIKSKKVCNSNSEIYIFFNFSLHLPFIIHLNLNFVITAYMCTCRMSSSPSIAVLTSSMGDSAVGSLSETSRGPEHTRDRLATWRRNKHWHFVRSKWTTLQSFVRVNEWHGSVLFALCVYACVSVGVPAQWCPAGWWSDGCCSPQRGPPAAGWPVFWRPGLGLQLSHWVGGSLPFQLTHPETSRWTKTGQKCLFCFVSDLIYTSVTTVS